MKIEYPFFEPAFWKQLDALSPSRILNPLNVMFKAMEKLSIRESNNLMTMEMLVIMDELTSEK